MSRSSHVRDVTDSLGRIVRCATLPRFSDMVASTAGVPLDRSAFVLLARLGEGPRTIGDLAAELRVDISTVSRQLAPLERDGFAHRVRNPADRRSWLVVVDSAGVAAIEAHRRARRRIFAELLAEVSEDELEVAATVLGRLADGIERFDDLRRARCHESPRRRTGSEETR